jgi:uncharacterized protein (DUF2249 family)
MSHDSTPDPQGSTHEDTAAHASTTSTQVNSEVGTIYQGQRDKTTPVGNEVQVTVDGEPLDKRTDLLSASPSEFEWGYGGSGPAQLAIAILAHVYGDEFACEWYQQFKTEVIAALPEQGWTLTTEDLDEWREVTDR